MTKRYEATATITHDDDEMDVQVRAYVEYGVQPGGSWGGTIDGDIEAFVDGAWWALDALSLAPGDSDRCEEALCDACCEDDVTECVDYGHDDQVSA